MTEFVPLESFRNLFTRWWLVLGLAIAGGLIGWSIHFFQPPVYEAHAELTVAIDIKSPNKLTQYDEDHIVGTAGGLLQSSAVIEQTISAAQVRGFDINKSMIQKAFSVERKQASWALRVRDFNPATAVELANLWANQAYSVITKAHQNALQAELLVSELQGCFLNLETVSPAKSKIQDYCGNPSSGDIQTSQWIMINNILLEQNLADGIYPQLLVGLGQPATVPANPVVDGVASLAFAGMMIGFLLGAASLFFWK